MTEILIATAFIAILLSPAGFLAGRHKQGSIIG
jgi:hypothetical protein